jgi:hypothetical protein
MVDYLIFQNQSAVLRYLQERRQIDIVERGFSRTTLLIPRALLTIGFGIRYHLHRYTIPHGLRVLVSPSQSHRSPI